MSQDNVEKVRQAIDEFNRRDFDAALAIVRDDVTWERFLSRTESTTPLVRGKEELRAAWESQIEAVALGHLRTRGRASGVDLQVPVALIWRLRDGKVIHGRTFSDQIEALRAAGLE